MHRIFSNLKGFILFNFYTHGDGWDDSFNYGGDKENDGCYFSPGNGFGDGDGNQDEKSTLYDWTFGDGDIGNANGDSACEDELEEFHFDID